MSVVFNTVKDHEGYIDVKSKIGVADDIQEQRTIVLSLLSKLGQNN